MIICNEKKDLALSKSAKTAEECLECMREGYHATREQQRVIQRHNQIYILIFNRVVYLSLLKNLNSNINSNINFDDMPRV